MTKDEAEAVTSLGEAFKEKPEITSFDELRYFTNVTSISSYTFVGCSALREVNFENIQEFKTAALRDCAIEKVIAPEITKIGDSTFTLCYNITAMLFGPRLTSISQYAFWQMTTNQTALVCLATTPPTLAGNNNLGFMSAIYVPDSAVADYQAATNWSSASAKFKPISQLATDNPTLYAEIEQYLFDFSPSESYIKSGSRLTATFAGVEVTPTYSVDSDIATIDSEGVITFSEWGTVRVTASYNGKVKTREYTLTEYDIEYGVALGNTGATSQNTERCVVGFVPLGGATNIKFGVTSGAYGTLNMYKEDGTYVDYWNAEGTSRTIPVGSATKVKATFVISNLDNSYIYDSTNEKYLWKGKNVE